MKQTKYIIGIFLLLVNFSCKNQKENTVETENETAENIVQLTDEQLKAFTLSTIEITERDITKTLRLNGSIDVPPQNLVSVSSALGGYVKWTKLLPGMHFKKGEVIARMEDNQFIQLQQDYLTTKALLVNAEAEYQRQKQLNQSKASSDKVYFQAKTDYQTLQITQKSLEEKLRMININPAFVTVDNIKRNAAIYAPFDGFVSQVFVNTGKYVSPSDVLFELIDPRDLHLNLKVFEKDLGKISVGQSVIAFANGNPDKKYEAEIILTGKNIGEDKAVEVHAHFLNQDPTLIPGMYMNAELQIPVTNALTLPDESIVSFEGGRYVFEMLGKNQFRMLMVETGSSGNNWTEVLNGGQLNNKKIVKDGAYTLLMALKNEGEE